MRLMSKGISIDDFAYKIIGKEIKQFEIKKLQNKVELLRDFILKGENKEFINVMTYGIKENQILNVNI